jgi:hypothetical protein
MTTPIQPTTSEMLIAAMMRVRPDRVITSTQGEPVCRNGTYSPHFDSQFVSRVADAIVSALEPHAGSNICLRAYTAPWPNNDVPHGQLNIEAYLGDELANIAIIFGASDMEEGKPGLFRSEFDHATFAECPTDPHSADVHVASFDECWAIVCNVIKRLDYSHIEFAFGV